MNVCVKIVDEMWKTCDLAQEFVIMNYAIYLIMWWKENIYEYIKKMLYYL